MADMRPTRGLAAILGAARFKGSLGAVSHALLACSLLRLAFALLVYLWSPSLSGFLALDTPSYILPARELAAHGTFTIDGVPDIYRTPGYSLALVPGVLLGRVELWAILLNLLLAGATAWGIHRLAQRVTGDSRIALAAAAFYAVDPLSLFHVSQVTSETLFTCLAVWCLDFFTLYLAREPARLRPLIASALLLAAATWVRPISVYLPWLLAAVLAASRLTRDPRKLRRAGHIALFLILSTGPVFAWQARNLHAAGYGGLSAVVDVNAYYFQAAAVRARLEGKSMMEMRMAMGYERELHLTEHPRERTVDQAAHFRAIHREALDILRPHWPVYARIHLAGLCKVLTNPGASGFLVIYNRFSAMEAVAGVYPEGGALQAVRDFHRMRPSFLLANLALGLLLAAYYLAAARGLFRLRRSWTAGLSALVLAALYFTAVSGGANSVSRFRHPIMPILCIFAGAGAVAGGGLLRPASGEKPASA